MACSKYTLTNTGTTQVNFNYRRCDDAMWEYQVELEPNQTKNIWLAITIGSVVGHIIFSPWGFTGIIGLIACGVYLADIRVKINEMTRR